MMSRISWAGSFKSQLTLGLGLGLGLELGCAYGGFLQELDMAVSWCPQPGLSHGSIEQTRTPQRADHSGEPLGGVGVGVVPLLFWPGGDEEIEHEHGMGGGQATATASDHGIETCHPIRVTLGLGLAATTVSKPGHTVG